MKSLILLPLLIASITALPANRQPIDLSDDDGQLTFSFDVGALSRSEVRSPEGEVIGNYSFVDDEHFLHFVQYRATADHGFEVASSKVEISPEDEKRLLPVTSKPKVRYETIEERISFSPVQEQAQPIHREAKEQQEFFREPIAPQPIPQNFRPKIRPTERTLLVEERPRDHFVQQNQNQNLRQFPFNVRSFEKASLPVTAAPKLQSQPASNFRGFASFEQPEQLERTSFQSRLPVDRNSSPKSQRLSFQPVEAPRSEQIRSQSQSHRDNSDRLTFIPGRETPEVAAARREHLHLFKSIESEFDNFNRQHEADAGTKRQRVFRF